MTKLSTLEDKYYEVEECLFSGRMEVAPALSKLSQITDDIVLETQNVVSMTLRLRREHGLDVKWHFIEKK